MKRIRSTFGAAAVLAGAAAPARGLLAPRPAKGSPPRNLGGGSRRSAYGRAFGTVMSPAADIFAVLSSTDNLFYGLPAILAGIVVGAALLGPAVAVGILAALTNPLFKWTNDDPAKNLHKV